MYKKIYEVEWSYTNELGYCYTEHRRFKNHTEQCEFAQAKVKEPNVYEVREISERVWRED